MANRIMNVLQLPPDWRCSPPVVSKVQLGSMCRGFRSRVRWRRGETDGDARSVIPEGASGGEAGSTPAKAVRTPRPVPMLRPP